MLARTDVVHLRCPTDRAPLQHAGPDGHWIEAGELVCAHGHRWPIRDRLARLYVEDEVTGNDKLLRYFYDGVPFLHDAAVLLLLPTLQLQPSANEENFRASYLPRLELARLAQEVPPERPIRILETGIGCGANLPYLARDLPPRRDVELWGMDLSTGMLRQCRKRLERAGRRDVRLIAADAHALPFPDAFFDRCFHVGGIGNFRDVGTALAEMARVARPGTPIVAVDEQLDRSRRYDWFRRLAFRAVTFYDDDPHCPVEHLPPQAHDVLEEQIQPFFYSLRYRVG